MSTAQSVASSVSSSVARSVAGVGGGALPLTAYQVLSASAKAHYNGLGDSPNDVSGLGNHGTWTGTPSYSAPPSGIAGKAFDTSSGNYLSIPSSINGVSAWTIAGWCKATSLANNCSPFVGTLTSVSYPMVRWTSADSKLHFYAFNGAPGINNITGSTVITTATWYHVALQYNGTIAKIWINGVDVGSGGTVSASFVLTADAARIGGGYNASAAAWVGQVADLFLFDSFLSGADIATLIAG